MKEALVQSLNTLFFPPHVGAESGRAKRVHNNFHAHAQNAAIFPPAQIEGKSCLESLSRFGLWQFVCGAIF